MSSDCDEQYDRDVENPLNAKNDEKNFINKIQLIKNKIMKTFTLSNNKVKS